MVFGGTKKEITNIGVFHPQGKRRCQDLMAFFKAMASHDGVSVDSFDKTFSRQM